MLLLDRHGPKEDVWERAEYLCQAESNFVLAPFGAVADSPLVDSDLRLGALLETNRAIEDVAPFFGRLELIVIHFANATDGRGFVTARRLRWAGYKGTLRAFGALVADQFPEALASGFDEIEAIGAGARQPVETWMKALDGISFFQRRDDGARAVIADERLAQAVNG